jgi:hypothetical protein
MKTSIRVRDSKGKFISYKSINKRKNIIISYNSEIEKKVLKGKFSKQEFNELIKPKFKTIINQRTKKKEIIKTRKIEKLFDKKSYKGKQIVKHDKKLFKKTKIKKSSKRYKTLYQKNFRKQFSNKFVYYFNSDNIDKIKNIFYTHYKELKEKQTIYCKGIFKLNYKELFSYESFSENYSKENIGGYDINRYKKEIVRLTNRLKSNLDDRFIFDELNNMLEEIKLLLFTKKKIKFEIIIQD